MAQFTDPNNPNSLTLVPNAFTIVAGPIGASGPEVSPYNDHSFSNIQSLANNIANTQISQGINPLGLAGNFLGLHDVYREGDANADSLRQPFDFYTPDTFNYVTLDISADGKNLAVNTYGINSYGANSFAQADATNNPLRQILGFQLQAATVPEPSSTAGIFLIGALGLMGIFRGREGRG